MSQVRRVARNAVLLIGADIIHFILAFFAAVSMARYLGTEGYGVISFALAFTAIFGVIADLGLQGLMVREIARDKSLTQKYVANVMALKGVLVMVTFGLIALAVNLMGYPTETIMVVYMVGLALVLNSFNTTLYAVFRGHERMEYVSLGMVLGSGITLGGVLFAIVQGYSIIVIATVYVIAAGVTLFCLSAASLRTSVRPGIEVDFGFWKQTLKQAWPFALVAVFLTVYYWIDSVMLSIIKGDAEVGLYNAAYRLLLVLQFIPQAYFGALYPVMSRMYVSSKESLSFVLERSLKYMFILAVPIALGTTLLAHRIVVEVFGVEYGAASRGLEILIWSIVVSFASASLAAYFNSVNRQRIVALFTGLTVLANVALNLVLIPAYGLVGASIATVATSSMNFLMAFIYSLKLGNSGLIRPIVINAVKVLAATAIMGVFVSYCDGLHLLALIPVSGVIYFMALMVLGGIDRQDVALMRSIVARR